jgi:hypothetical protein
MEPARPDRRLSVMSNVVAFEPYRLRQRRHKIAAACRSAVAQSGMLVIQDDTGRILSFSGQFRFFDDGFENCRESCAARIPYDAIKRVRVPHPQHFNGRPNSG